MSDKPSNGLEAAQFIRNGNCPPDDRGFYVQQIETRVRCLEEDEPMFGLTPHEQVELALLKRVLREEDNPHG